MLLFSLTDEEKIIQTIVSLLKQSGDQLEEKVTTSFFQELHSLQCVREITLLLGVNVL